MTRRVVLLGAGHAHLHALKHARRFAEAGAELVAVAPEPFWYSGLATGVLGGAYPEALDRIDVGALAAKGGGRVLRAAATALDPARRRVTLDDGATLDYDALSIDLGSSAPPIEGEAAATAFAVKPIRRLLALKAALEARFAADPARPVRVVVAGGGATGCEVAANLVALARARGGRVAVTILAGRGLLPQAPEGARRSLARWLDRRGVEARTGARVARLEGGRAVTEAGEAVPFDFFVNATGLRPNPALACFGLPLDRHGALRLDARLRSIADPRVHGGGDCAAVEDREPPRIGVHAIRQGPTLLGNLLAAVGAGEAKTFTPQRRWLWIMNLGDGEGLAIRGGLWWRGRLAFRLKDRIDRRFLAAYAA